MTATNYHAIRHLLNQQKASLTALATSKEPYVQTQGFASEQGAFPLAPDIQVEKTTIGGIYGEWVSAPTIKADRTILYLHGGGYVRGSCASHRELASRISRASESRVLVIEYRLAPKHPYPAAVDDAVAVYRALLETGVDPKNMVVAGDSAGGGLTMALLQVLRDNQEPLPAAAVLLSPWTDMTASGESIVTRKEIDPWLASEAMTVAPKLYLGDADPKHPHVSPIFADLHGMPPLLVHVGTDEILYDDAVRLVDRAQADGVDVTLKVWEGMWHVFQAFAPLVREGQEAIDEIGEFIRKKWAVGVEC
ncbi:alpha/beta hydrolase [Brevibacillus dissolubilis]|uniref:alpha/beta hydrolase n=1 Tax=Brevibacillus dissolubilis TaxID=1844116 RepID=UPI001116EA08|nr:alpha/beta hydrolase [Brevibacillus dissolubilis]